MLVVATSRPSLLEKHPRWGEGLSHHVRLPLTPLSRRESRELVRQILRHVEQVPDELVGLVIDNAEGNPFYIEELVTWLIDAGVITRDEPHWVVHEELVRTVAVPSTLKGVLQSRLDALTLDERNLLQRASVVGRVFWDLAVAHLDDRPTAADASGDGSPEGNPDGNLENLRRRELLLQREVSRFASAREFLFKHALLRDVAYDGVLRAHRERYHRRAADWLAETSAAVGRQDEYAAIIAEHYERARDPAAAGWYLRAGAQAAGVYALAEARRMLDSALELAPADHHHLRFDILLEREELLDRLGEREPQQQALAAMAELTDHLDAPRQIRLDLAQSRVQFSHSEYDDARRYADRAAELAGEIHHTELLAEATLLQGKALTWAAEGEGAHACLLHAVELAREVGRPAVLGESLRYLSMLASNSGDFPTSLEYAAQAREVFARAGEPELEGTALAQGAITYFNLGRYDEAQAALEETLPIFRRSGHRYRETINMGNLSSIALMRGQLASAERWARQALDMAHQLEELEAGVTYAMVLGAVATLTSRFELGRTQLGQALETARQIAVDVHIGEGLARLSTLELAAGERDLALELGREGAEVMSRVASGLDRGNAHLSHGYAAAAVGLWDEAQAAFADAHAGFLETDLEPLVREAAVGLAGVDAGRGQLADAVERIGPVLEHLDPTGLSQTWRPGEMLLSCHRILVEAADPRADDVLHQARSYLVAMAAEVGDPELEAGFRAFGPHAELLDE